MLFFGFEQGICWRFRAQGIIDRDLKILTRNNFGLNLKKKMTAMVISLSVMKSAYISLIIGPRGLACEANQ